MRRVVAAVIGAAVLLGAGAGAAQEPQAVPLDTLRVDVTSRASSVVSATRAVEVLERAEIRRLPARTVAEVLARVQGVDVLGRSAAQTDVALRGSTFEQVLVLVDGVRMNDAQTGHFHLDLAIPLEEVERIEVLRGGGSSVHGSDAMAGVIHIVTRRGGPAAVGATVGGGSFGTARAGASAGGSAGSLRARVAAEGQRSDGHRPGTDARVFQARGSVEGEVAGGGLRADLGVAVRDFGARHFYTAPDATFDEYERTRTTTASVGWRAPAGSGWTLAPRLAARRHADDFLLERDDPGFYRNVHTSWQVGGEVVARGVVAPAVGVSLGAEAYRDRLESTSLGDLAETRAAVFGEVVAGREGRVVAHGGLRGDRHSAYGTFVSPSAGVAVWPAPWLRVRAAAGRSFRAPNWTDRFYQDPANQGDPDLRPERAWSVEAGAAVESAGAAVALTGFRRDARDLIDWARPEEGGDGVWQAMNIGRAVFEGLELEGRVVDGAGTRWVAQASVLRVSSRSTGRVSKYALRPLTRTASLEASREVLGVDLSLRGHHARRVGESPRTTADLRLSTRLAERVRARVDLTNAFDARFLDVTGLPAPGRGLFLGVDIQSAGSP